MPKREEKTGRLKLCLILQPGLFFVDFPFVQRLNRPGIVTDKRDKPLEVPRSHRNRLLQHDPVYPLGARRGRQGTIIGVMM